MATQSSILAWEISWAEQLGRLHTVHGVAKSQTRLSDFIFTFIKRWSLLLYPQSLDVASGALFGQRTVANGAPVET